WFPKRWGQVALRLAVEPHRGSTYLVSFRKRISAIDLDLVLCACGIFRSSHSLQVRARDGVVRIQPERALKMELRQIVILLPMINCAQGSMRLVIFRIESQNGLEFRLRLIKLVANEVKRAEIVVGFVVAGSQSYG